VLVAMSGGVDSAVTACLLMKKGFEVIGIHMRLWKESGMAGESNETHTKSIANKIGIPLKIIDLKGDFKRKIVDSFLAECAQSVTPNPCVNCNRLIKFGLLIKKMKDLKADFLATGHYVRIKKSKTGKTFIYDLFQAKDKSKDQSYFLYTLTQKILCNVIFPLGGYKKSHIRHLASSFGLPELNRRPESQNLCFVAGETGDFLKKYINKKAFRPGPIITVNGEKIGTHRGLPFYTIGQRKGVGIGGNADALYVVGSDVKKNVLIMGPKEYLYRKELSIKNLSLVTGEKIKNGTRILAVIRYRAAKTPAVFHMKKPESKAQIIFDEPVRAVTPGQSVVFYDGEKVLGGGIITRDGTGFQLKKKQ
jgi:tRNA-uridine 2-sulfurtransferase